ncbi:MAG: putative ABC transporter permease, partial [Oscillospiraceae bacterium]
MHKRKIKNKYIENPQGFAAGINFYKLVLVFFAGCVIGYAVEMLYAYALNGMWINRQGLIYGPFNQIYGLGMVLCVLVLYRLRNANAVIIFLSSAVLGSVFEYLCSFAQEMAFGCVSWEYSDTPANLHGRTNLFFGL